MGPRKQGNAEDVSKLKVAELKARLEEIGESTKGKKAKLVARLEQALKDGAGEEGAKDPVEESSKQLVEEPAEAAVKAPAATEKPVSRKPDSRKADMAAPVATSVAAPAARGAEGTQKLTASQRMNLKKKLRKQKQREARIAGKSEEGGRQNDKGGASSKKKGKDQGVVMYETDQTRVAPDVNMSEEVWLWLNRSRFYSSNLALPRLCTEFPPLTHSNVYMVGIHEDLEAVQRRGRGRARRTDG